MQKVNGNKQTGMTFIGLVLVIATVVFLATIGMKVVPAYIEFSGVKKIVKRIASESNFNEMSKKNVADAFDKAASADYVTVIKGADLILEKGTTGNVVRAEYQVVLPIVANASVLLDFNATSAK
jgi:Tfp pilus assembly major pilin PilA